MPEKTYSCICSRAHIYTHTQSRRRKKSQQLREGMGRRELTFPHNGCVHLFIPSPEAGESPSLHSFPSLSPRPPPPLQHDLIEQTTVCPSFLSWQPAHLQAQSWNRVSSALLRKTLLLTHTCQSDTSRCREAVKKTTKKTKESATHMRYTWKHTHTKANSTAIGEDNWVWDSESRR